MENGKNPKIIDVFALQQLAQEGIEESECAAALHMHVPADFVEKYLNAFNPYTVKALIDSLINVVKRETLTAAIEATQRSSNGAPIRTNQTDS